MNVVHLLRDLGQIAGVFLVVYLCLCVVTKGMRP